MYDKEGSDVAEEKHKYFSTLDPFPDIPSALLNSADIQDYIETIGMVNPFQKTDILNAKLLKGTILHLRIGGQCVYWNEKKEKIKTTINEGDEFILKHNSIAFVSILEELRLPRYIIARFNLKVSNAQRGILLGTGPIVDPLFKGRLVIPLHNLTSNDYVFYGGESLIAVEFTKLSPHESWHRPGDLPKENKPQRKGKYEPWNQDADNSNSISRDIEYYLRKSNMGNRIESSLPALEASTEEATTRANKTSDRVDTALSRYNVGLFFSFAALLGAIVAIVNIFRGDIKEIKDRKYDEAIRTLQKQHEKDSCLIDSLKKTVQYK